MSKLEPTPRLDLSERLLRGVIGLSVFGSIFCALCGVSALIGAPSFLTIAALFPIVIGAMIVNGTATIWLIWRAKGTGR